MREKTKEIWLVYPYGAIPGESFLEARYIRFGRVLANEGYKVVWWTTNFSHTFKKKRSTGAKTIKVIDGFWIEMLPAPKYRNNISLGRIRYEKEFSRQLKKAWNKATPPDVIITAGTGLVTSFKPIPEYTEGKDIKIIYDIMDVHMFESYMKQKHKILAPAAKVLNGVLVKKERFFFEKVDAVSALGKNQLQVAINKTGKAGIPNCLVYNGIDVQAFRDKMKNEHKSILPDKEERWIWCVYAGSLGPSYDVKSIIESAQIAEENGDKIMFIIAGAGPQEDEIKEASEKNSRLLYLGSVKPEQLPGIYKHCDIGLATYASYSTVDMPDKFYDYCAAGLAVVNSLKGEIKEHISNKGIGLQYKAGDGEDLYRKIKAISEGDIIQYKRNAYEMGDQFDFGAQMKPFLEMLKQL